MGGVCRKRLEELEEGFGSLAPGVQAAVSFSDPLGEQEALLTTESSPQPLENSC